MLSVYIKVVPIPAAVWLFGSGLLGLVGIRCLKWISAMAGFLIGQTEMTCGGFPFSTQMIVK